MVLPTLRPLALYRNSGPSFASETIAYMNALSIAYDNTIYFSGTAQEISGTDLWAAVETHVLGLKSNGIWDLMYVIHPIIGGTSTRHSKNLINPAVSSMVFANSPTHSEIGIQFNGTNQNTVVTHNDGGGGNNVAFGVYTRNSPSGYYIDGDSGKMWLTDAYIRVYTGTQNNISAAGFGTGLITIMRGNTTQQKYKRNKNSLFTWTASLNNAPTAYDYRHSNRTTRAAYNMAYAYKSQALTDTQLNTLYDLVQALQTSLKRQV